MPENPVQAPIIGNNNSGNNSTTNGNGSPNGLSRLQRVLTNVKNTDKDFKGAVEELGVLGTVLENYMKYYKTFDKFIVALLNYSGRIYDHGADLKTVILDLTDPYKSLLKKVPLKPKKMIAVLGVIPNLETLDQSEILKQQAELKEEYEAEQDSYDAI